MIVSPACWRRFLKLRMANFIAELESVNPRVKVAYHSDGMIAPIIPQLIEIGADVLNPIQPASMDPAEIKREFGDRRAGLKPRPSGSGPRLRSVYFQVNIVIERGNRQAGERFAIVSPHDGMVPALGEVRG